MQPCRSRSRARLTPMSAHACSRVARAHSEPQTHAYTGPVLQLHLCAPRCTPPAPALRPSQAAGVASHVPCTGAAYAAPSHARVHAPAMPESSCVGLLLRSARPARSALAPACLACLRSPTPRAPPALAPAEPSQPHTCCASHQLQPSRRAAAHSRAEPHAASSLGTPLFLESERLCVVPGSSMNSTAPSTTSACCRSPSTSAAPGFTLAPAPPRPHARCPLRPSEPHPLASLGHLRAACRAPARQPPRLRPPRLRIPRSCAPCRAEPLAPPALLARAHAVCRRVPPAPAASRARLGRASAPARAWSRTPPVRRQPLALQRRPALPRLRCALARAAAAAACLPRPACAWAQLCAPRASAWAGLRPDLAPHQRQL
ncbi:hypothetical protein GQ55_5G326900 [Panicum hallii var. hallii]|uniref:Uncharacterized protein n=1 Tax=Panicum hallii var. hallii TaxID=1504633 RepID=A0A2T7DLT9_9POAL|nr:hypothetical protein GQ55_5G326800 [Panicum hallii var. hallii]PUZ56539.1 hypothetical protein GQ55_5G326900 [Panicum hallii var. hallii]